MSKNGAAHANIVRPSVSPLLSQRALAPQGLTEQGSAVQPVYGSPSYPAGQEQT